MGRELLNEIGTKTLLNNNFAEYEKEVVLGFIIFAAYVALY